MANDDSGTRRRPRRAGAAAVGVAVVGALLGGCTTAAPGAGDASREGVTAAPGATTPGAAAPAIAVARPPAPEGELPRGLQTELQAALERVLARHAVPGAAAGPTRESWTSTTPSTCTSTG
jgi:hypothetical protein